MSLKCVTIGSAGNGGGGISSIGVLGARGVWRRAAMGAAERLPASHVTGAWGVSSDLCIFGVTSAGGEHDAVGLKHPATMRLFRNTCRFCTLL